MNVNKRIYSGLGLLGQFVGFQANPSILIGI